MKLPPTEPYVALPHQIRAHRLIKADNLGDVTWSAFILGAVVLVQDLDQYGVPRSRQMVAQEGDYLVWRDDNKGWKNVIKKEEFERMYAPLDNLPPEKTPFREAYDLLCVEKFGDLRNPEHIIKFYQRGYTGP